MKLSPSSDRALGFWMCTALIVGGMVGSGVFLLPAALAPFGWNALFGWGVSIPGALCLAYVFSRLAYALPEAGGPYAYTREAFGQASGFLVAWSYWVSVLVANAVIAVTCVNYLHIVMPRQPFFQSPAIIALLLIWLVTAVNCWSVKAVGVVQVLTTGLKLIPLIAVALVGAYAVIHIATATILPFRSSTISLTSLNATATLTLYALIGFESATFAAGKVKNPARTIPRATMLGVTATGVIYILCVSSIVLLMPPTLAATSQAPFADFASRFVGQKTVFAIAGLTAVAAFGALNGWTLVQGELPLALARDGVFPAWFARVGATGTPIAAHLLSSGLVTLLVVSNYSRSASELYVFMIRLATVATLVTYLMCALALVRLHRDPRVGGAWPLAIAGIAGALFSIWALYGAGGEAICWGLVLMAAGAPVYLLSRRDERIARSQAMPLQAVAELPFPVTNVPRQ